MTPHPCTLPKNREGGNLLNFLLFFEYPVYFRSHIGFNQNLLSYGYLLIGLITKHKNCSFTTVQKKN
jgi:hypothetical protein